MTALLWTVAAAGFWTTGHWQAKEYSTMQACETARPIIEADMRGHGYTGIQTICIPVKDGD